MSNQTKRPTAKFLALAKACEQNETEQLRRSLAFWIKRALKAESMLAVRNPQTAIGLKVQGTKPLITASRRDERMAA